MNTLKAVQDHGLDEIRELEAELTSIRKREDDILGELARRRAMLAIATASAPCAPPGLGASVPACPLPASPSA